MGANGNRSGRPDVLLVNPGNRAEVYQHLANELSAIEPPTWCALIAGFMRARGFQVDILDAAAEGLGPEGAAEKAAAAEARLAAVFVYGQQPSASTQNMTAASELCAALKRLNPKLPILLGGGHPSALPERTLLEETVDYVCQGEGQHTVHGLVEVLKGGGDIEKVPGLWYRDGGTVKSTHEALLSRALDDELPGMAWDLLPMEKYRAHNWHCFDRIQERQPYASLYTTLGCPFKCTFCCINAPFGGPSYRFWSPKRIVDEIGTLVGRYGVRNIKIVDEMFFLNVKHVSGICDGIIERGYDLNIWAYARVDTIKDGLLEKMRKAGITWLALGIESASERVRDDVDKSFSQERVKQVIDQIHAAGIHVIGNYIFGLPEDDLETMQQTLDMAIELDCDFANFYAAMAYPGSKLYEWAVENILRLPEKWNGYSQHSVDTLPLPTKHISAAEVLRFRDHAFRVYFNHSRYQNLVERTFGRDTLEHVRGMTSHALQRRFA